MTLFDVGMSDSGTSESFTSHSGTTFDGASDADSGSPREGGQARGLEMVGPADRALIDLCVTNWSTANDLIDQAQAAFAKNPRVVIYTFFEDNVRKRQWESFPLVMSALLNNNKTYTKDLAAVIASGTRFKRVFEMLVTVLRLFRAREDAFDREDQATCERLVREIGNPGMSALPGHDCLSRVYLLFGMMNVARTVLVNSRVTARGDDTTPVVLGVLDGIEAMQPTCNVDIVHADMVVEYLVCLALAGNSELFFPRDSKDAVCDESEVPDQSEWTASDHIRSFTHWDKNGATKNQVAAKAAVILAQLCPVMPGLKSLSVDHQHTFDVLSALAEHVFFNSDARSIAGLLLFTPAVKNEDGRALELRVESKVASDPFFRVAVFARLCRLKGGALIPSQVRDEWDLVVSFWRIPEYVSFASGARVSVREGCLY